MLSSLLVQTRRSLLSLTAPVTSRLLSPQYKWSSPPITNLDTQTRGYKHVIKYSAETGEKESCIEVMRRYTRLHWGGWIRAQKGQGKRWKKIGRHRWQAKQFSMVGEKFSSDFDKLTNSYHRMKRHYPDDPLKYYHERNLRGANLKPLPAKADMPPALMTKSEMERNWYKSMKLVPELDYKRPPRRNDCLYDNLAILKQRILISE